MLAPKQIDIIAPKYNIGNYFLLLFRKYRPLKISKRRQKKRTGEMKKRTVLLDRETKNFIYNYLRKGGKINFKLKVFSLHEIPHAQRSLNKI